MTGQLEALFGFEGGRVRCSRERKKVLLKVAISDAGPGPWFGRERASKSGQSYVAVMASKQEQQKEQERTTK